MLFRSERDTGQTPIRFRVMEWVVSGFAVPQPLPVRVADRSVTVLPAQLLQDGGRCGRDGISFGDGSESEDGNGYRQAGEESQNAFSW